MAQPSRIARRFAVRHCWAKDRGTQAYEIPELCEVRMEYNPQKRKYLFNVTFTKSKMDRASEEFKTFSSEVISREALRQYMTLPSRGNPSAKQNIKGGWRCIYDNPLNDTMTALLALFNKINVSVVAVSGRKEVTFTEGLLPYTKSKAKKNGLVSSVSHLWSKPEECIKPSTNPFDMFAPSPKPTIAAPRIATRPVAQAAHSFMSNKLKISVAEILREVATSISPEELLECMKGYEFLRDDVDSLQQLMEEEKVLLPAQIQYVSRPTYVAPRSRSSSQGSSSQSSDEGGLDGILDGIKGIALAQTPVAAAAAVAQLPPTGVAVVASTNPFDSQVSTNPFNSQVSTNPFDFGRRLRSRKRVRKMGSRRLRCRSRVKSHKRRGSRRVRGHNRRIKCRSRRGSRRRKSRRNCHSRVKGHKRRTSRRGSKKRIRSHNRKRKCSTKRRRRSRRRRSNSFGLYGIQDVPSQYVGANQMVWPEGHPAPFYDQPNLNNVKRNYRGPTHGSAGELSSRQVDRPAKRVFAQAQIA